MEAQPLVYERVFDAPASNVWKAITQKEFISQWYFELPEFEPVVGFEFSFESLPCTEANIHLCKVTEVIAGKKLSYTWKYKGYEGDSLVTFEIFEEGRKKTRLRLTHTGLETFPRDIILKKNISGGWAFLIGTSLENFLQTLTQQ